MSRAAFPSFFFLSFGGAPNPKCLKKKLVYSKKINDNNEGASLLSVAKRLSFWSLSWTFFPTAMHLTWMDLHNLCGPMLVKSLSGKGGTWSK